MSEVETICGIGVSVGIVTDQKTNKEHVLVMTSNTHLCISTARARQLAADLLIQAERVDEYNAEEDESEEEEE